MKWCLRQSRSTCKWRCRWIPFVNKCIPSSATEEEVADTMDKLESYSIEDGQEAQVAFSFTSLLMKWCLRQSRSTCKWRCRWIPFVNKCIPSSATEEEVADTMDKLEKSQSGLEVAIT